MKYINREEHFASEWSISGKSKLDFHEQYGQRLIFKGVQRVSRSFLLSNQYLCQTKK